MSPNTHYFGISLGPIYQTIQQARKTRELWVTSYLFSFVMRSLVDHLGAAAGCKVLSPIAPDPSFPLYGAGVLPDRLYGATDSSNEQLIKDAVEAAIKELEQATIGRGTPPGFRGDRVRFDADLAKEKFWSRYLRIVHVVLPASVVSGASGNILFTLNERLDSLELQPSFFPDDPEANGLDYLLEHPYRTEFSRTGLPRIPGSAYAGLTKDMKHLERFPSTAEIGTLQLYQFVPNAYEEFLKEAEAQVRAENQELNLEEENAGENDDVLRQFYELLFAGKSRFVGDAQANDFRPVTPEPHHKYFCSVYADGDNFGTVITQLGTNEVAIQAFSQKLTDYATQAAGIINDFGGKPVFIGGDDLVFLAPVVANDPSGRPRTVFNLLEKLNGAFDDLKLGAGLPIQPSMSYGVTLSFYKFPLFEAQGLSYKQLNNRAKKAEWSQSGKKATTAFRLLKHSGSYFEGAMGHELLKTFNQLVNHFLVTTAAKNADQAGKFLSSFAFKLRELEALMAMILIPSGNATATDAALDHFFENYFNEPIHKSHQQELSLIKDFARACYGQELTIDGTPTLLSDNFYALLRLLDFMTPKTILEPTAPKNSANFPAYV